MFQGRGMRHFGAENLPPPSPGLAASLPHVAPALFVRSSILLFVHLVGCCVVSLPLVVVCPVLSRRHASHVIALHLISFHPSRLVVDESSRRRVSPRLASSLPSHCTMTTSTPLSLIFHGLMVMGSTAWLDVC
jgi:hypothetical protein